MSQCLKGWKIEKFKYFIVLMKFKIILWKFSALFSGAPSIVNISDGPLEPVFISIGKITGSLLLAYTVFNMVFCHWLYWKWLFCWNDDLMLSINLRQIIIHYGFLDPCCLPLLPSHRLSLLFPHHKKFISNNINCYIS